MIPIVARKPDYRLLRQIRRDPTVALMRMLMSAAITGAPWGLEADDGVPAERIAFLQKELNLCRDFLVEKSILGGIDFGWSAIYIPVDVSDGRTARLARPRYIVPDTTTIHVNDDGDVTHLTQPTANGRDRRYDLADLFLVRWRLEASPYGEPLLVNVEDVFKRWRDVDDTANRYDLKIAGSQLVVKFPHGTGLDRDGVEKPNAEICEDVIRRLEASGAVGIERVMGEELQNLQAQNPEWEIEVLKNPNAQPQFIPRQQYLDRLKVRGMGFPERAVLEAESSGSRADSMTAAGFAIRNLELAANYIGKAIDEQIVDYLMYLNYGPESVDTIRYVPGPVDDQHRRRLFTLAEEIAKSRPETIDLDTLYDNAAIPKSDEVMRDKPAANRTEMISA